MALFRYDTFYTGFVDPYNSQVFTWADGSLAVQDIAMANNESDLTQACVTWHSYYGEFETRECYNTLMPFCVRELEGDVGDTTEAKLSCIEDSTTSTENQQSLMEISDSQMTLTLCVQLCKGMLYTYGLVKGESCKCFLYTYSTWVRHGNLTACGSPCPGNQFQTCSSANASASVLFKTSFYPEVPANCEDLFRQGVRHVATYIVSDGADQWDIPTLPTFHLCYGPIQQIPKPGLDWVGWREGEFIYKFAVRDSDLSALDQCWGYGYGAYPLSIVDAEELDFIMSVLAADNDLRDVLEWEIGYTIQASQKREGWMHPDLYHPSVLADSEYFRCSHVGLCMLMLPGRNESQAFWPAFDDRLEDVYRGVICKTTLNFLGCQSPPTNVQPILTSTTDMTATLCLELCRGQSWTVAAVTESSCYCVDSLLTLDTNSSWSAMDTAECSRRCPGHRSQFCGGANLALWYYLGTSLEDQTAHSCDDIINNGIFFNSTYEISVGNWVTEKQVCGIECAPLNTSTNAQLSTEVTTYRTQVTLTCPLGQEFPDGSTETSLECRFKGWSSIPQNCQETQCSPLVIDNAVVSSPYTSHGSNVTVTCNQGYAMATDRQTSQFSVTCDVNQWVPDPPAC
ncbi:hypothetical protein EGW08_008785, partial [Elysia chlorotica]